MSSTHRRPSGAPVLRSLSPSPSGKFNSTSSSSFASSSTTAFTTTTTTLPNHHRSASPTRVNLFSSPSSQSIRFSTPSIRSISAQPVHRHSTPPQKKKTCMCSPTNHPGSFRCSFHKNQPGPTKNHSAPYQSNRLYARRSAMTNSLVRIGTVEGDLVKRALAALIRPSSHHQKRRGDFQPRKSRLSAVTF